jgi:hypothetical protein
MDPSIANRKSANPMPLSNSDILGIATIAVVVLPILALVVYHRFAPN